MKRVKKCGDDGSESEGVSEWSQERQAEALSA